MKMNEKMLRRNLRLYGWFKIFNKRVFLPLTAIYLVAVGHVTLAEIGIIAAVTGFVSLLAQMPTGYFADRYTRRLAMMIGSSLLLLGTGVLVFWPTFVGGLVSGIFTGIGFAFIAGASQAIMHDSMEACGKGDEYVKSMGRAQSRGLLGNVVLIALVPMTYAIDERMPFILGVVAFLILVAISWAFVEPKREYRSGDDRAMKDMAIAVRSFVNKRTAMLFVAIALVFGLYVAPSDYHNLVLEDLGMLPQYIGWVLAVSSLVGAVGGYLIHHLQRLSFEAFMALDILVCCGFYVAIGVTRNLVVAATAFLLTFGFWRLRNILYQHYLMEIFPDTRHKATLVSLLGFSEQLFTVILPVIFAFAITHQGYYVGFTLIGLASILILGTATFLGFDILKKASVKKDTVVPAS